MFDMKIMLLALKLLQFPLVRALSRSSSQFSIQWWMNIKQVWVIVSRICWFENSGNENFFEKTGYSF